jgi:lipoprotein-anchoring transpeptidase ErfK/SrfK
MRPIGVKLLAATVLTLMLGACVPELGIQTATVETAPPVEPAETAYVSRADGAFTIPAIPLEKLPEAFRRQTVEYPTDQVPGTIIINTAERHLYLVTGTNKAIRYGIAVGRAGFDWSGEAIIASRQHWPTWTPPPEMIARRPELEEFKNGQPGGPTNPLGARALYLTSNGIDYGYRIHGTPEWESIGTNSSSGCIRMINQDVIDLFGRAVDGAKVIVMTRDGQMPAGLSVPIQPKPKPKPVVVAAEPEPVVVPDLPSAGPV